MPDVRRGDGPTTASTTGVRLASVSDRRADALALMLMSFLALNAVSLSLIPIVAQQLQDRFAFSASHIGLLTSACSLAVSLIAIPAGLAAQRWGGRIMLVAVAVFAVGSLLFALGTSFESFMVARFRAVFLAAAGLSVLLAAVAFWLLRRRGPVAPLLRPPLPVGRA